MRSVRGEVMGTIAVLNVHVKMGALAWM